MSVRPPELQRRSSDQLIHPLAERGIAPPGPSPMPTHSRGFNMSVGTMQELFIDELKDLYSAEKQIVRALPTLAKATTSEDLKEALLQHLEETKEQVTRLEQIAEIVGKKL